MTERLSLTITSFHLSTIPPGFFTHVKVRGRCEIALKLFWKWKVIDLLLLVHASPDSQSADMLQGGKELVALEGIFEYYG